MADETPQGKIQDDDDVYAEVTLSCLYCVETGREYLTFGLMKCKHCGGTGKRTVKRRLTPREMTILTRAFEDDGESADDGKEVH